MKSCAEYREAAWRTMREGRWTIRFVLLWMTLALMIGLVQILWNGCTESMGIQTWSEFLQAKAKAVASGLDFTVPSRIVAIRMTEATAFEMFFGCILNGLFNFAVFSLFLGAAKGERAHWFSAAFGGFRRPLGVAWLYFRYVLQIALWTMLFVVPGIVAAYRYCQCWNLKVENPDWSAGRCLAESGRLMKGRKWDRFALDCSYWKPITLVLLGVLGMTILAVLPDCGTVGKFLFLLLSIACCWGGLTVAVYLSIGQSLFYLDLKDLPAHPDSESVNS